MEILLAGMCVHRDIYSPRSIGSIGHLDANVGHCTLDLQTGGRAAAHCQQAGDTMRLPEAGVVGFIRYGQWKFNIKCGTCTLNAVYGNGSAHQAHETFCNGHSKPGALRLAGRYAQFPGEHIKYMLREIGGHADTVVADHKFQTHSIPGDGRKLPHRKNNTSVWRRIFYGVGQQIQ